MVLAWALTALLGWNAVTVVTVNGHPITQEEWDALIRRAEIEDARIPADEKVDLPPEDKELRRAGLLRLLIDETLVKQYLDKQKVTVDEAKVEAHIAELTKRLASEGKSLDGFLKEIGATASRMREDIRHIQRWMTFVESQATDATLRKYFQANETAFDGTQVRASHIFKKVPENATAAERQSARESIDRIRESIVAGKSFVDLAKTESDAPTASRGGDLGYFPRKGLMQEPFAAAAFDLPPNRLSPVVETEDGFHLLVVTDRKPGMPVKYEEIVDDVKALYAEDLRAAVVARMRQSAEIKFVNGK